MTNDQKKLLSIAVAIFVIIVAMVAIVFIGLLLLRGMDYLKAFS